MIFVGYHKTEAYKMFGPISGKIMISRDIIIDENEAWNWTSNNTTTKPLLNPSLEEEQGDSDDASPKNIIENAPKVNLRPQRITMPLSRLQYCEVITDNEVK